GLKGGAANEKGEITLAALVKYVQDNVPKRIAIDLGADMRQRPFAVVEGYKADELVVAVASSSVTTLNSSLTPKAPLDGSSAVAAIANDTTGLKNEFPLARAMSPAFA